MSRASECHSLRLSNGDAELAFVPHDGGRADTATFDVSTSNGNCVSVGGPISRICTNLDRAAAASLRDALSMWLAQPLTDGVTG